MTRDEILSLCDAATPEATERALAWQIEDRDTLEWAMGILAEGEAEAAAVRRSADAARAEALRRITEREADLLKRVETSTVFLRSHVEEYARTHRATLIPGKRKTARFIHGEIAYRAAPERLVVEDEGAALAWCREQPVEADLVRTSYEINRKALGAHYAATNKIPPGCAVPPASETITVTPSAPDTITIAPTRKEIAK